VVLSYARSLRSPRAARSLEESVGVQLAAQATTGAKCDLVDRIGVQTQLQPQVRRCLVTHQQREEDRALKAAEPAVDHGADRVGEFTCLGVNARVGVGLDQLGVVLWRQADRAASGCVLAQLGAYLEPNEARRPGSESGVSAELAGFADDEQQCVGGCLAGDIVEVGAAEVPDTAGQRLLTHTAEPGSSAAAALALLA